MDGEVDKTLEANASVFQHLHSVQTILFHHVTKSFDLVSVRGSGDKPLPFNQVCFVQQVLQNVRKLSRLVSPNILPAELREFTDRYFFMFNQPLDEGQWRRSAVETQSAGKLRMSRQKGLHVFPVHRFVPQTIFQLIYQPLNLLPLFIIRHCSQTTQDSTGERRERKVMKTTTVACTQYLAHCHNGQIDRCTLSCCVAVLCD